MGFLGSISNYITPAVQAAGGIESGKLQGVIEKIKLDKQARDDALKTALQTKTMQNLDSEINARENPKAKPTYDSDRGVMVDPEKGIATPVAGIEPKPHAALPGSPEDLATTKAKAIIGAKYGYHPPPPTGFTPVVTTAADGSQHVSAFGTKTGKVEDTGVDAKAGSAGGVSGQTLMAMQRLGFTKNDLDQSIKEMEAFENNPQNLQRLTTAMQTMGAAGEVSPNPEAHGLLGVINNAGGALVSAGAQKTIAKTFPELAQYLYNKQRVGTAFTEVLPRPNQQLLGIEKGLSGIDVGWTPAKLADVQARRRGGQEMLNKLLETTAIGKAVTKAAKGGSGSGDINLGAKADPTATMSDADAWEYHVSHGMTKPQATAAVRARHGQ